jgi:predicted ABC-type ATPase
MSKARLRVFAGPNGSGKSTLFEEFSKKYKSGVFLNADYIEKELTTKGYIDLSDYNLTLTFEDLKIFLESQRAQSLIKKALSDNQVIDFEIKENLIFDRKKESHSYEGALISSFLRHHLLDQNVDFCFETVMSHPSKIDEVIEAKNKGFKTYLYFICIDDPEINISRVENRVQKGGHYVESDRIRKRYYETLKNLIGMVEQSDKCYFFDNSNEFKLISKISEGGLELLVNTEDLPNWFNKYLLCYYI